MQIGDCIHVTVTRYKIGPGSTANVLLSAASAGNDGADVVGHRHADLLPHARRSWWTFCLRAHAGARNRSCAEREIWPRPARLAAISELSLGHLAPRSGSVIQISGCVGQFDDRCRPAGDAEHRA